MACTGQMDSQVLQRMQISGSIRCCLITADAAGAFMGCLRGGVLGSVFLGAWLVSGCCFCLVAALVFALASGFVPLASAFALAWRRGTRGGRVRSCAPPPPAAAPAPSGGGAPPGPPPPPPPPPPPRPGGGGGGGNPGPGGRGGVTQT